MSVDRTQPPQLAPTIDVEMPGAQRLELDNGMKIVLVERDGLPIVDLRLLVRQGAAQEAVQAAGLTSLTADLLAEGAGEHGALEVAAAFERIGAEYAAAADWDCSVLGVHVLVERLPAALELLADIVQRPHLDPAEFARRREQRLDALRQERSDPGRLAALAFLAGAYPSTHRFTFPLHGVPNTVEALSHSNLVAYHRSVYRPAGATLVVVGAVTRSSLVPSLERAFGDWTGGPATHAEREPADHRQRRVVTFVDRPGAPQSELRIGHIGPPRDSPDYFALVVLNTVLGGAFTSRLNQRLREEKGFTYGARSGFAFRSGPGPFTVSTAVGAEATAEAVADVVEVIAKLRRELVSEAERSRATNYLALGLPRRIETGSSLAQRLTEIELYELEHDYFDRYAQRVRNVRADDMLAAARRHLDPDRLVIAIAGDRARTANRLAELGFAHIEVAEDLS